MKIVRFQQDGAWTPSFGQLIGDQVVAPVIQGSVPDSVATLFAKGSAVGNALTVEEQTELPQVLLPPVEARSLRDFYAFEQHVRDARRNRGLEMIPEWYDAPVFYFSNTASIMGHGADVLMPPETERLDFELEVAAIIGRAGQNIEPDQADAYIAGFCIMNDWSMRDVQRHEMKVGLGPCKGKDFATSIGPYLVTHDELTDRRQVVPARGAAIDLAMTAAVNGRVYSHGNLNAMNWTFAELIAQASRNTSILPGDVIGSGTVGTGCIVEFPDGTYPYLKPGDVVRLEVERLGVLENRIV